MMIQSVLVEEHSGRLDCAIGIEKSRPDNRRFVIKGFHNLIEPERVFKIDVGILILNDLAGRMFHPFVHHDSRIAGIGWQLEQPVVQVSLSVNAIHILLRAIIDKDDLVIGISGYLPERSECVQEQFALAVHGEYQAYLWSYCHQNVSSMRIIKSFQATVSEIPEALLSPYTPQQKE